MDEANLQKCLSKIMQWKQEGLSLEQINQQLLKSGVPDNQAKEAMKEWKTILAKKKSNAAFIYCGTGIILLTTGFLFTLLLFNSNGSYHFSLYGLTILGLILVFKGLIDLMS